jgi:transcriptional regulator with XRE-family HTH domain
MEFNANNKHIGIRLSQARKSKGITQELLAEQLGLSRSALVKVESGQRGLSASELYNISEILEMPMDYFFLSTYDEASIQSMVNEREAQYETLRISEPILEQKKQIALLLYLLQQTAGNMNITEKEIPKLMYFCDFNYFEIYEEQLSGSSYFKMNNNVRIENFQQVISALIKNKNLIRIEIQKDLKKEKKLLAVSSPNLKCLNAAELEIIQQVIVSFQGWSAQKIADYLMDDIPLKVAEVGELIRYNLVFYRRGFHSVRTYSDDEED